MIALKQAAIAGLGVVVLPGYVCREMFDRAHRDGCCPWALAAIPRSPLLLPTGRAFVVGRVLLDDPAAKLP